MPQPTAPFPPPPPTEPVQEGARWRWHRPSSEQVAAWFGTQPVDEGMEHTHYVGGVVIIPQSEKVKYTRPDGQGTTERYEMVYTPYVQIGTRLGYSRKLAELRNLIRVVEAEDVPRSMNTESVYFNGNMAAGLWWHVVKGDSGLVRFLCATARVSFYEPQQYTAKLKGEKVLPLFGGTGTKQVSGGADPNGIMKAQTGAIGRALGVAGILVVGTGIATAEDMQEFAGQAAPAASEPQLPDALPQGQAPEGADAESLVGLRTRAMSLQAQLQEAGDPWKTFVAWWKERSTEEGWHGLNDVPQDALKGVIAKMERTLADAALPDPNEPGGGA